MNITRRIAKNASVLFIATIISYFLGFLVTIYTARYLGAEGFGILGIALSITGIYTIFTDLGLNTLIIREVARDKSLTEKYITNSTVIKVFLNVLTVILTFLTVNIIHYSPEVSIVIYLVTFSILINAFVSIFNSIFQAYEQMEYMSVGNILNSIFLFAGVYIAVSFNLDIYVFAALYFIANLLTLIYSIAVYFWKFSFPKINIDLDFWKSTLKEALPFGITSVFGSIYYWIAPIFLSVMIGNIVVGWYNAAYKLMFVFLSLYTVYMAAIFPMMSIFFKTSIDSLKFSYERSFKYLLIISLPIAVGTTLVADKIILLIYGPEYLPAISALQILIWTIPLLFINGLSGNLFSAINRQTLLSKIVLVAAVINIVANLILIPKFSLIGSSIAIVITELALLPILTYILLKTGYTDKKSLVKYLPTIIAANIIMAAVIMFLRDMNLILIIIIAAIVYFASLYLFKAVDDDDIKLVKNLLGK